MNSIILTGADHSEPIQITVAHIAAFLPTSSLQGAPAKAKCQVFIAGGIMLSVQESFQSIQKMVAATEIFVGLPFSPSLPPV